MSKQLYEEALADVRKITEVAEDNAKRAIIDAVTPRIKDLIERELLREHGDLDGDFDDGDEEEVVQVVPGAPGAPDMPGKLVTDVETPVVPTTNPVGVSGGTVPVNVVPAAGDSEVSAAAISTPDEEGKVTLDLDALTTSTVGVPVPEPMFGEQLPVSDEYEISMESVDTLKPLVTAARPVTDKKFEAGLKKLGETVDSFKDASKQIKATKAFKTKIAQMISRVENMYEYVQESIKHPAKKISYENQLETHFQDLNKLQEHKMSNKSLKQLMNEADVTLKLTGLPDETDLEAVGVDLITGDEEEGDELDLGTGEGGEGDLGGEEDLGGDLDLDTGDEEEESQMESRKLSDDTIVEIDEGVLRREILRMKKARALREETKPASWGHGVGAKEMDDFGGGKDEGEPFLDGDVTTESQEEDDDQDDLDEVDGALSMDEQDDDLDEIDQVTNEMDGLDQLSNRRKGDEFGADVADSHQTPTWDKRESIERRLAFEGRLQERAKRRAASLKKEAAQAASKKLPKREALLKKEYARVARRYTESVARSKKFSKLMAEASEPRTESTKNGGSTRPAETQASKNLRAKLAETNLFNAKLLYVNKLLQNEALSKGQKASIIERLDDAKSIREVKLVYESMSKNLDASRSLKENTDRRVLGSSSRATQPGSTNLSEGYVTERWQKLAGISK